MRSFMNLVNFLWAHFGRVSTEYKYYVTNHNDYNLNVYIFQRKPRRPIKKKVRSVFLNDLLEENKSIKIRPHID